MNPKTTKVKSLDVLKFLLLFIPIGIGVKIVRKKCNYNPYFPQIYIRIFTGIEVGKIRMDQKGPNYF